MKKLLVAMFAIGLLAAAPAFAQMGMMGRPNNSTVSQTSDAAISAALQDIYKAQNVASIDQISCSKVSDDQFEKLGDAYMGAGISEQQHTAMEQMMGGEGSATLTAAHVNMGRAYLGCWAGYNSGPVNMSMMGSYGLSGMQPFGMMGFGGHMGYGAYSWFGGITMLLVWVLMIAGIIALIKWLKHKH